MPRLIIEAGLYSREVLFEEIVLLWSYACLIKLNCIYWMYRFLEQLERRQNESALIRNICDIILDYAKNHFSCYVRYCTNQVYQTRQLLECMWAQFYTSVWSGCHGIWCVIRDENILFREYVKRLESHECCQKLQLQSFLLLPMQRITRMPLLILNILNRIPLQHADRKIVEDALRIIQSVSGGHHLEFI